MLTIEFFSCLCTDKELLIRSIACVQLFIYWFDFLLMCNRTIIGNQSLLMCRPTFIKLFDCLYAKHDLLILSVAYVHVLLFIELSYCLCAENGLLRFGYLLICNPCFIESPLCLCAIIGLLTFHLACVQLHGYWGIILLMCSAKIIEYSCCLCAITNLFIGFVAHIH